jgi:hypothetical protein
MGEVGQAAFGPLVSAAAEYVSRPINIKDRRERRNEFIQYRIVLLF